MAYVEARVFGVEYAGERNPDRGRNTKGARVNCGKVFAEEVHSSGR